MQNQFWEGGDEARHWLLPTRQRENTGGGCQYGPMRDLWWRSTIAFLQPQHRQSSKDAQRGFNSQINLEAERETKCKYE